MEPSGPDAERAAYERGRQEARLTARLEGIDARLHGHDKNFAAINAATADTARKLTVLQDQIGKVATEQQMRDAVERALAEHKDRRGDRELTRWQKIGIWATIVIAVLSLLVAIISALAQ